MSITAAHKEHIILQASRRLDRLEITMRKAKKSVDEFREEDKIRKE